MKRKICVFTVSLILGATPYIWAGIKTIRGTGGWSTAGFELIPVGVLFLLIVWGGLKFFSGLLRRMFRQPEAKENDNGSIAPRIFLGVLVGVVLGAWFGGELRMRGFERAAAEAAPLVAAIEKYVGDNGGPPATFEDLMPDYSPNVTPRLPPLEIVTAENALQEYGENSWALTALVPRAMINWDRFIYLPDGNYPASGFGGTLEPVGDWAYVHE